MRLPHEPRAAPTFLIDDAGRDPGRGARVLRAGVAGERPMDAHAQAASRDWRPVERIVIHSRFAERHFGPEGPEIDRHRLLIRDPNFDFCSFLEGSRGYPSRGSGMPTPRRRTFAEGIVPSTHSDADCAPQSLLRLSAYAGSRGMGTPSRDRIQSGTALGMPRRHRFHAAIATACSKSRASFLEPRPVGAIAKTCCRTLARRSVRSMSLNDGSALLGYQR